MLQKLSLSLVDIYQRVMRKFLPSTCRFVPTCSDYAKQAVTKYGFFRGGCRAAKRLMLCHPFSGRFGHDPLK